MKYQKIQPKPPKWSLWDILLLQIVLCLIAGIGLWNQLPPFTDCMEELKNLPALTAEDFQPAKEAVETFLNQYLLEEGMGGELPVENGEIPDDCSMAQVTVSGAFSAPISGKITSAFGFRKHPLSGSDDFHTGIDIAAGEGEIIHAAADGIVTEAGWSDVYGNYLVLKHSADFSTKYAHCSRLIAREGDILRKGERIAAVGSTGVSTGPHLHFETLVAGKRCNPLWILPC